MLDSLVTWLNSNPGLAALFLPVVAGVLGHMLDGTPIGRLLRALGIDFGRLLAMVTTRPVVVPGDGSAQPNASGEAAQVARSGAVATAAKVAGSCLLALFLVGCTPAAQATAAQVGGAVASAVDGPACDLVEARAGSALAGVLCEGAAGALEALLAGAAKATASDVAPRARVVGPAPRCKLVAVRVSGRHLGYVCSEHEQALLAALGRDGGTP